MTKHDAAEANRYAGRRLCAIRRAFGLTQAQVGEMLDVSYQQVQKLESGKNRMNVGQLDTLCREFDLQPAEFFSISPELDDAEIAWLHAGRRLSDRHLDIVLRMIDFLADSDPD